MNFHETNNNSLFFTLIPCKISLIILTRLSFSFICWTCKAFNFVAMNAFRGIRRIITKIPAKTLGPKMLHKNITHNIIWNGALHNMLKKGILKKMRLIISIRDRFEILMNKFQPYFIKKSLTGQPFFVRQQTSG